MGQCIDGSPHIAWPVLYKATPVPILVARQGRNGAVIQNQSGFSGNTAAVDVYIGASDVTNDGGAQGTRGLLIKSGQSVPQAFVDSLTAGALYAVLASGGTDGTQPLCVLESRD